MGQQNFIVDTDAPRNIPQGISRKDHLTNFLNLLLRDSDGEILEELDQFEELYSIPEPARPDRKIFKGAFQIGPSDLDDYTRSVLVQHIFGSIESWQEWHESMVKELDRITDRINYLQGATDKLTDEDVTGLEHLIGGWIYERDQIRNKTEINDEDARRAEELDRDIAEKNQALNQGTQITQNIPLFDSKVAEDKVIEIVLDMYPLNDLNPRDLSRKFSDVTGVLLEPRFQTGTQSLYTDRYAEDDYLSPMDINIVERHTKDIETFPGSPLEGHKIYDIASAQLDNGIITQEQFNTMTYYGRTGEVLVRDVATEQDIEETIQAIKWINSTKQNMAIISNEAGKDVAPGRSASFEYKVSQDIKSEQADGIIIGGAGSKYGSYGKTSEELLREEKYYTFVNKIQGDAANRFKKGVEYLLSLSGITTNPDAYEGDYSSAAEHIRNQYAAEIESAWLSLTPEERDQYAFVQATQLIGDKADNFNRDLDNYIIEKQTQSEVGSLSTVAKARNRLKEYLAPFGVGIEDISDTAANDISRQLAQAQRLDVLDEILTPDVLEQLVKNRTVLNDLEGALGSVGIGMAGTGGAFQDSLRDNVIPRLEEAIKRAESANPYSDINELMNELVGSPTPFSMGLQKRRIDTVTGLGEQLEGPGYLPPEQRDTPSGLSFSDVIDAWIESKYIPHPLFSDDIKPYMLNAKDFAMQMDPSKTPTFDPNFAQALQDTGVDVKSLPGFGTLAEFSLAGIPLEAQMDFDFGDPSTLSQAMKDISEDDPYFHRFVQSKVGAKGFAQEFEDYSRERLRERQDAFREEAKGLEMQHMTNPREAMPEIRDAEGNITQHASRAWDADTARDYLSYQSGQMVKDPFKVEDYIREQKDQFRTEWEQTPGYTEFMEQAEAKEEAERRSILRSRPRFRTT